MMPLPVFFESVYSDIGVLLLIWFVGWAAYFLLSRNGIDMKSKPELATVYFVALSFVVFYFFKGYISDAMIRLIPFYVLSIFIVFFLINHFYFLLRKEYDEPLLLIKRHPLDHWLEANRRALLGTSAHILFQQSIITAIILVLISSGLNHLALIGFFAVIFGAIHIPLIFFKGSYMTLLFTASAVISAIVFPTLIFAWPSFGFVLNYAVHSIFYAIITFIFWKYQDRIKQ